MQQHSSYHFTHALCRKPAATMNQALRAVDVGNPDMGLFREHHRAYVAALKTAGCTVTVLESLDAYPDSVFIEDAALCFNGVAIALRPGAQSRFGESAALMPDLNKLFNKVISLPAPGYIDGGDILFTDNEVLVGLSERTDKQGVAALQAVVEPMGYSVREVQTPKDVLHFKSDCALLDHQTIFSTKALAKSGCFEGYQVIEAPATETAAANLIRVNDVVLMAEGYPQTRTLLQENNYKVVELANSEAAKVDGGLSCMSCRY